MSERNGLRPGYDLPLPPLDGDQGSRGTVYRAVPPGSRVLDVGCDTGRFGEALRSTKGCAVEGIENDAIAAEKACERLDRVLVRKIQDQHSFDGLAGFDVVLFMDVLEHLEDPWSVLRGARAVLRPAGEMYVVVPNVAHVSVVRRLLSGEFQYQDYGTMDRTHLRWFTRKSLADAIRQAGFGATRLVTFPLVPWIDELRAGRQLSRLLARIFPDLFTGSILAIARNDRANAG